MQGLHILLVENDSILREVLRRALALRRHVVMAAGSCKEAEELLVHHRFEVALIDWSLGDCKGTDLIKKLHPGTKPLIYSGWSKEHIMANPLEGALAFLMKPMSLDDEGRDSLGWWLTRIEDAKEHTPPRGTPKP